MDIKNNWALVTGAASGMGAETARYLKKAGAKLILLDQNKKALSKLATELKSSFFICDVSNGPIIEAVFKKIKEELEIPRICINCAGIAYAERVIGKAGPHPFDLYQKIIEVNLLGTFNIIRMTAFEMSSLEPLKNSERGVIINTSSIAAFEGQVGQAAYSASKGGINAMTLPLAREFAQYGIRVMTIAPGIFETPMMAQMPEPIKRSLNAATVFPKRLGQAGEFAELAMDIIKNPMLNGTVIRLDGALRLGINIKGN